MKIKIKSIDKKPCLILKYENDEWNRIKNILENKLELEQREINNLWGQGLKSVAYVEQHEELREFLLKTMNFNVVDDLNKKIIYNNCFNISIFRIVPNECNEIVVQLDKFLTIKEIVDMIEQIKKALKVLLEIENNVEISIKVVNENESNKS